MKAKLTVFVLSTVFTIAFAQVQLRCSFVDVNQLGYTCNLQQALLVGDENQTVTFTGQHVSGKGDGHIGNLQITESRIAFFPSKLFTTFPGLTRISSVNSGLERITLTAFEKATKLRALLIDSRDLEVLGPRAFESLTLLNTLSINGGKVGEIFNETFVKLSALEVLNLRNMSIKTINENAFQDLKAVKQFYLNVNELKEIPSKLFHPMTRLENLDLDNNQIERLNGDLFLQNGANLKALNLNNNKISKVSPNFIRNLVKLEKIAMVGNSCFNGSVLKTSFPANFTSQIHESLKKCYENYEQKETTTTTTEPTSTERVTTEPTQSSKTTPAVTLPPPTSSTTISPPTTILTTIFPPSTSSTATPTTTQSPINPPSTTENPNLDSARRFLMEFSGLFRIVDSKGNEIVKKNVEEFLRF